MVKQMGNIEFLILAIGSVVFFTLLLVTGNTMAISVRERTNELAVLKAIGYSDTFVLAIVLAESLLIATIGGAIGLWLASLFVELDPTQRPPAAVSAADRIRARRGDRPGDGHAGRGAAGAERDAAERRRARCGGSDVAIPVVYNLRSVKERWTSSRGRDPRHRRHRRGVRRDARARARLQGRADLVGAAGERHRAAGGRRLRDDERRSRSAPSASSRTRRSSRAAAPSRWSAPRWSCSRTCRCAGTTSDANVQMRGVSPRVLAVRDNVRIVQGRFFTPGTLRARRRQKRGARL